MTVIEALESIEAAAQGNERLDALKKADEACRDLRSVLFLALSPDVTFGVKKLPLPPEGLGQFESDFAWLKDLRLLLHRLRYRTLTGNEAQIAVAEHLGSCRELQYKWSERILRQDLRLNIGAKDVNKVLGKNTIYLFEVPLATDYAKVKAKDLKGVWSLQPKLDGGRCVAVIPGDGSPVRLLSRTGKEWPNFESIRKKIEDMRHAFRLQGCLWDGPVGSTPLPEDLYVDGEVVSIVNGKVDFQSIQKTMLRKDGVEVGELRFIVFDIAEASEWKDPKLNYEDRLEIAGIVVRQLQYLGVTNVEAIRVEEIVKDLTPEQLEAACRVQVEAGFEGLIARRMDVPVENKRSRTLLKVKLFKDDEAEIVGTAELQREGKGAGTLGALVCKTKEGVQFEIGTGLDAKTRDDLWAQRETLPGTHVNFKYFELTNDRVPRLPVYRSLRSADDIGKTSEED